MARYFFRADYRGIRGHSNCDEYRKQRNASETHVLSFASATQCVRSRWASGDCGIHQARRITMKGFGQKASETIQGKTSAAKAALILRPLRHD